MRMKDTRMALAGVLTLMLAGCSDFSIEFNQFPPKTPQAPLVVPNTIVDAQRAVTDDDIDSHSDIKSDLKIGQDQKLAILSGVAPNESHDLLTVMMTMAMRDRDMNVVERQVVDSLLGELDMLERTNKATQAQLDMLGEMHGADFLLVAAITTLESEVVQVYLPQRKFDPSDAQRYADAYRSWRTEAFSFLDAMDKAAQINNRNPKFPDKDRRDAWLLRNSIARVRLDLLDMDTIGMREAAASSREPAIFRPDFFNRTQRRNAPDPSRQPQVDPFTQVSANGPFVSFESPYRPLLNYIAQSLPKSPDRMEFEWLMGPKYTFNVTQATASVAYRLIESKTGKYVGMGVLSVRDISEAKAISRLAKELADELAAKMK